ncbi:hypothetical protein ACFW04_012336 [Cataglyphis niger]
MMRKCFGDECLLQARFYDLFKMFEKGRKSVEDDPRSEKSFFDYYAMVHYEFLLTN